MINVSDFGCAWRKFYSAFALGGLVMWAMVIIDAAASRHWFGSPEARLAVQSIYFDQGRIYQTIAPNTLDALPGVWSAVIYRGRYWVCGGAGSGLYDGSEVGYTPDDWAGGECELVPGVEYSARASWSNKTSDGGSARISARFDFVYQPPPDRSVIFRGP